MIRLVHYFYVEDLQRLGASIESVLERKRFLNTVAENRNCQVKMPDGRTVAELRDPIDVEKVRSLEKSSGLVCAEVSPALGE